MVLEREVGKVIKFLDTVDFIYNNNEEIAKILFFFISVRLYCFLSKIQ